MDQWPFGLEEGSNEPSMLRPYFFTLETDQICNDSGRGDDRDARCKVFRGVDASLKTGIV